MNLPAPNFFAASAYVRSYENEDAHVLYLRLLCALESSPNVRGDRATWISELEHSLDVVSRTHAERHADLVERGRLALSRARSDVSDGFFVVARDGSQFVFPDGRRVTCPGRGTLRRIVVELMVERIACAGGTVSAKRLIRAGWPAEQLPQSIASNRLHVALDALRKLGLRSLLLRGRGGWFLDPSVPVAWEA